MSYILIIYILILYTPIPIHIPIGAKPGFFSGLVPAVAQNMGSAFPEINNKITYIQNILKEEEQSFTTLLERGVKYFNEQISIMSTTNTASNNRDNSNNSNNNIISGDIAFFMYDTLGFPLDLTQLMAAEKGYIVDTVGFNIAMTTQKERGRQAGREKRLAGRTDITLGVEQIALLQKTKLIVPTEDSSKYMWDIEIPSKIVAIVSEKGEVISIVTPSPSSTSTTSKGEETIGIVLSESPFYAEAGGQISDTGTLVITRADGREVAVEVVDVQSYAGYLLHTCVPALEGESLVGIADGDSVLTRVDYNRRRKTAPNHSITHVLNYALRKVSVYYKLAYSLP